MSGYCEELADSADPSVALLIREPRAIPEVGVLLEAACPGRGVTVLAASQLKGPHTVHVYDFGASDDGIYYIAMEHLSGRDVGALVNQQGPLPPALAARFALQACASLMEAHAAGIIHRDIKPGNVMVNSAGQAKVMDFGLAKAAQPSGLTGVTTTSGTLGYMAPEQLAGNKVDAFRHRLTIRAGPSLALAFAFRAKARLKRQIEKAAREQQSPDEAPA